ncbi:MAG TPA: hypothetical protein P5040_04755 [Smithella sp.]|nr:hypothetical protein [Smithella sp.]HRS97474.1 hypothetical protein [Smithella sp.]
MGIIVHGFFMIGFPGETEEQINMTIDVARKSALNTAGFYALTAYPATELYEIARKAGVALPDDFDSYHRHYSTLNLTAVPLERLRQLRRKAYWKFYLNPMRIYRIIKMTPRKGDIFNNIKIHLSDFF